MTDMLERVDVYGFREKRYKEEGTRMVKGKGISCKWFWKESEVGLDGVGVAVKEELSKVVEGVNRVSDRILELKLGVSGSLVQSALLLSIYLT